ncbi:uncharacterized protein LOC110859124 [Folsomia candida]|uniref:uncharacterized protein LOC110859124 n=1 Tax=Folsomia candida TaxID=158441 RepID=UPI000B8F15E8|nr:uncharacterized protein LOC110859124 [Folsomia candida]
MNCSNLISLVILLLFCSTGSNGSFGGGDDDDAYDDDIDALTGMECYQCVETPGDQGHLSCEVERGDYNLDDLFHENADVFEKILENGDDEDDDITKFIRKAISALPKNPCNLITKKVLDLISSEDDKILPIHLVFEGKDVNSRYLELKEAISTIQFQKRESSSWLTVEVQLRNQDDTFSFILPDFDQDLVSIPGNSIFYTAL